MSEERRVADVVCPQCGKGFRLTWNDYTRLSNKELAKKTLFIRDCPSGGVYDAEVVCPHCGYEEDL